MKLVTSQAELSREFVRLIRDYKKIRWATAWAGVGSAPFAALVRAQHKIKQMVVGIHFYQTHPQFIETFRANKKVRFIKQPDGTFHPKLYMFFDDDDTWEMLVGSSNFTNAAFSSNTEASILLSSDDDDAPAILAKTLKLLDKSWDAAQGMSKTELRAYTTTWKNHQAKLRGLSGRYGNQKTAGKKKVTPMHEVPVAVMTWKQFMTKVRDDRFDAMPERLATLAQIRRWFTTQEQFSALSEEQRKFVAGLPNDLNSDTVSAGWFGSMRGAGVFHKKVSRNDANISRALDAVPLYGEVTKSQYQTFVSHFSKAFSNTWVSPATRLLAMKRPDTFVCLDKKNRRNLCRDFGIKQSGMNLERYWEEVVERIRDSEWWLHPAPKNNDERQVALARAAFLDSLYYEKPE